MTISVLLSVYKNEKPEYLKRALECVPIKQTHKLNPVVIVEDMPLPKTLEEEIDNNSLDLKKAPLLP